MEKSTKAKIPIRKIIGICLIITLMSGIGVFASNIKINNVKIILSNGYEMDVVTTKTNIAEILDENNIVLLPEENVVPNLDKEISDNKTIRITKFADEDSCYEEEAKVEETPTAEEILESYNSIIEKIEVVEEVIPYETITKDVSDSEDSKREAVIQQGRDGIKEVTYKVKYQNGEEIERNEISSNIIQEPINKVVEVRNQFVTSRGDFDRLSVTSYGNGTWSYSDEDFDLLCAITATECSSSYEGALAVITCACNRTISDSWGRNGSDPLSQYKARGQFCYSINNTWRRRLNGNYPSFVADAVRDALNGKRNHEYLSFRASYTGYSGEYIGGNVYFNSL